MSEVTKTCRMSSGLAKAIDRLAGERGQSFSTYVVATMSEKVSGKESTSLAAPLLSSLEASKLMEVLRNERLGHAELTEIILSLTRIYRESFEDRNRTSGITKAATDGLEDAKIQLQSMVELGGFTTKNCLDAISKMEKSLTTVSNLVNVTVEKINHNLLTIEEQSGSFNAVATNLDRVFEKKVNEVSREFSELTDDFTKELTKQRRTFLLSVANRWQWAACILFGCLFVGAGSALAWQFFDRKSEIEKITQEKLGTTKDLLFFLQEGCQGRVALIERNFCQKNNLNKSNWKNPYR